MSVSNQRSANRSTSRGRASSSGSGRSRAGSSRSARSGSSSAQRSGAKSASQARSGSSEQQHSNNHSARETITNIGIGVLGTSIGLAGGVLLGRTALQRNRKVLGIPMPNKIDIDLAGVSQQIGEASRQFGKLAGEMRTMRQKAEQVGRILT